MPISVIGAVPASGATYQVVGSTDDLADAGTGLEQNWAAIELFLRSCAGDAAATATLERGPADPAGTRP